MSNTRPLINACYKHECSVGYFGEGGCPACAEVGQLKSVTDVEHAKIADLTKKVDYLEAMISSRDATIDALNQGVSGNATHYAAATGELRATIKERRIEADKLRAEVASLMATIKNLNQKISNCHASYTATIESKDAAIQNLNQGELRCERDGLLRSVETLKATINSHLHTILVVHGLNAKHLEAISAMKAANGEHLEKVIRLEILDADQKTENIRLSDLLKSHSSHKQAEIDELGLELEMWRESHTMAAGELNDAIASRLADKVAKLAPKCGVCDDAKTIACCNGSERLECSACKGEEAGS